jgi:hypothetical protein
VTSAGVEPSSLRSVLLVGGSSRIPLVAQLVGAALGVPVAVDANPKYAVASGAALDAAGALPPADVAPLVASPAVPRPAPTPGRRRVGAGALVGAAALVLLVVAAVLFLTRDDGDGGGDAVDTTTTTAEVDESTTTTTTEQDTTTTTAATTTTPTTAGGFIPSSESVEVIAVDNAFNGVPSFLPPAEITFDLRNEGSEDHELVVVVDDGTFDIRDEPGEALRDRAVAFEQGPIEAAPQGVDSGTAALGEGSYFIVCLLPSVEFDGLDHRTLGMLRGLTVR